MPVTSRKTTTTTGTNAVVQAVESYIQNQNLLGEIAELDDLLYDLIDLHKDNEVAVKRIIQCIYNLLQSNNRWNVKFGSKVFHKLISVVITDCNDVDNANSVHRQLVANVLICIQIHVRKFPTVDGKFLLRQLWSMSLNSTSQLHAAQVLVQLFDDFLREMGEECACASELYDVIQDFLLSGERDLRRSAYFLMRKLLMVIQGDGNDNRELSTRVLNNLQCNEQLWSAYVTIMESLEEQQSHLILPTLETLLPLVGSYIGGDQWLSWLRILYVRLLKDNNILVLRWTLTYCVNFFDVSKLLRLNLLTEFLAATNKTQLFNVETYFLPQSKVENFMSQDTERQKFLEALVKIPWQSVPLHFWLTVIKPEKAAFTNKHLLLQLCSRVRSLTNSKLRQKANERVFVVFEASINSFTLGDYMNFVDSLFNISDEFCDYLGFTAKLRNCTNIDEEIVHFNKRCCEIIVNDFSVKIVVPELIRQLSKLAPSQHGWWRLPPLFSLNHMEPDLKVSCSNFYRSQYDIDFKMFEKGSNLTELQQKLMQQLNCQSKDEKSFVLEHCVDCFVEANLERWDDLNDLQVQPCDLLEKGTKATFEHLAQLLELCETKIENETNVLLTMVKLIKKYPKCENSAVSIIKYSARNLPSDENEKLLRDIVNNCPDWVVWSILINAQNVPNSLVVEGILEGETSTGDARTEEAYTNNIVDHSFSAVTLRDRYIYFTKQQSQESVNDICSELKRINLEINEKKPRYFENCKEHRIKMRIARALLMMKDRLKWSQELWDSVLSPNDQLNISFLFECLVAVLLPNLNELLNKMELLGSLKPSQQVSIISIAQIYCLRNWTALSVENLKRIVSLLLPHTMGANYQTRLLAQLVLHGFAVKSEYCNMELPLLNAIRDSVEVALGTKLHELKNETRLVLSEIIAQQAFPADVILYMTNAPFDEYIKPKITFEKLKVKVEIIRNICKKRKNSTPRPTTPDVPAETANINVQRKMNPINDVFNNDDLAKIGRRLNERELIVVASLIDKLPNLGGLARTCEVLGIKTLILGAKSFTYKSDFTNLSMTAEKTLNIHEVKPNAVASYLISQQCLGYKIVGAEQTAHSISISDFQFPEKCVLLLGHEKHGIPVDLIALLDYAVEIPQIGVVRSLNVHVTGSLFIWEYCKQHLRK